MIAYTNTVVELTGPDDKGYLQWWHNASQIDISEIKRSEDGTRIEIDEIKFKKFEMPAQEVYPQTSLCNQNMLTTDRVYQSLVEVAWRRWPPPQTRTEQ